VAVATFTSINGTLNSTPSTRKKTRTFIIQFFSNPSTDPDEGKTFLGQIQVQTDRQGNTGTFGFSPLQKVPVGQFITATATNKKTGDTSEFSQARVVEEPGVGT
jgi:trimeric autotransporter adhesin